MQHIFTRIMNCPPFTKIRAHLRRQLPSCCLRYLILFIINDKPFCYFILHKKWCGSLKVEKESKKIRSITNYNKQKEEKKRLKNNIPIVTKSKVIDQLLYTLKFANISWTLHNNNIYGTFYPTTIVASTNTRLHYTYLSLILGNYHWYI